MTLDDDELGCLVDEYGSKATYTGSSVVNLQIGSSLRIWEEKSYELRSSDYPDNENGDDDDGGEDDDEGSPAPTKIVPLGYYIPIYSHPKVDGDEKVACFTPGYKTKSSENVACTIKAQLDPGSSTSDTATIEDPVSQAVSLHSRRCAMNRFLHKSHSLVVDNLDPTNNCMVMVKVPSWDNTASRADLQCIGAELAQHSRPYIRIPYVAHNGRQRRYLLICNGDAKWSSRMCADSLFSLFSCTTHRERDSLSG